MSGDLRDGFVQVAADGPGKRVRNVALEVPQADGTMATVYMQVVQIRDENGSPILDNTVLLGSILAEMRKLTRMYGLATQQLPEAIETQNLPVRLNG